MQARTEQGEAWRTRNSGAMPGTRLGYRGGDQGNWRNREPPTSESTDAKIEAILSQVLTKLESIKSDVNKMSDELSSMDKLVKSHSSSIKQLEQQMEKISKKRPKKDHCMVVETRSRNTTIERQAPITRSNVDENNLGPTKAREWSKALFDPCMERRNAITG
ncbi:hypothetical protein HAX54_047500 [Datura stramonium]|uniref:Uncharacterized protein n=1 Tax=Datura stramonium TaxID=4076 RepID=A0ABS8SSP3_DATST|nr:hypothetical protein [Datura stramonium]